MFFGILTYLLWGLFPAYFPLLTPAQPLEILAHRIVWTAVLMIMVCTMLRGWLALGRALRDYSWRIVCAAVLIAVNWLVYVIAINSGHVADAALGYFINPLVSVFLGMVVFQERLRRLQQWAVALAGIAVVGLTIATGKLPLIPLALAFSFGFYGMFKKGMRIHATTSLTAETLILFPFAAGYLGWLSVTGASTFLDYGAGHMGLLMLSGVITAVPLLCFAAAAQQISLGLLGMLQYITPTIQFFWAVFVVQETIEPGRWIGFVVIWIAVALYISDSVHHLRRQRREPLAH